MFVWEIDLYNQSKFNPEFWTKNPEVDFYQRLTYMPQFTVIIPYFSLFFEI